MSREDWLGLLVDREATSRENKRLARRLRGAKLRQAPSIEDVDYRTPRGLDRALFQKLATCEWMRDHQSPGGRRPNRHREVVAGLRPRPQGLPRRLLRPLQASQPPVRRPDQARGEGRLPRLMTTLERIRLLIIDDWGPEPLTAEQRRDLLEIVDDRYESGSLLITSQVPVGKWHEVIADPTLGDAILDRIVHRAHRIELKGPSMRKRHNAEVSATAQA